MGQFFRNFSGWTEPIHWVLDRNFRKFWLNGSRPGFYPNTTYHWFRALIMPSSFLRFVTTIFLYFKVIKARMENEILWNGQPHLRVRVQRTFKASRVKISSRQLLEKRGQEITCSCGNLRPDRVYVILGKEDRRKRVLYLDNFSTALEWSRNGKTYVRAYRRRSSCPERVEWNKERWKKKK